MSFLRNIFIVGFYISAVLSLSANSIKLFAEGEGATKEIAIRTALKSALEQAYGTFVSSNTEIFNDELIVDQIVSLQFGNIQKYKIISEGGDSVKYVFIEAIINKDKLADFARSKGSAAELDGNSFATNLQLHKLNMHNIAVTMESLCRQLILQAPTIYDYELVVAEPILDNDKVYVPVAVKCKLNANSRNFFKTAKSVDKAVEKALSANKLNGSYTDENAALIKRYRNLLPHIQRLACYNFVISDNLGNTVKSDNHHSERNARNAINFENGRLIADGINIERFSRAYPIPYSQYLHKIESAWNNYSYRYFDYLIDGLIEVPYESTRQPNNTAWFYERYNLYPDNLRIGELNGTVRFMLIYTIDQISKVRNLEIRPDE